MAKAKQKMQSVSFRTVDEFLDYLPADQLEITELLRTIIFNCLPTVSERLIYNVPYFRHHRDFCFIWPASILWGTKKSYQGVRLGFINGNLMHDDAGYLDRGNRKKVCYRDYKSVTSIDIDLLKAYMFEAILIDERLNKSQ